MSVHNASHALQTTSDGNAGSDTKSFFTGATGWIIFLGVPSCSGCHLTVVLWHLFCECPMLAWCISQLMFTCCTQSHHCSYAFMVNMWFCKCMLNIHCNLRESLYRLIWGCILLLNCCSRSSFATLCVILCTGVMHATGLLKCLCVCCIALWSRVHSWRWPQEVCSSALLGPFWSARCSHSWPNGASSKINADEVVNVHVLLFSLLYNSWANHVTDQGESYGKHCAQQWMHEGCSLPPTSSRLFVTVLPTLGHEGLTDTFCQKL